MPQIINTNIASLTAQRNLNTSQSSLNVSLQRLSSGLRINSAKDDAAGLAITNRFTTQIRGLNQAIRNANDGISLAQTAEGALGELTSNLQRIRELAVQSANATNSNTDRATLDQEVQQRLAEIDRIASQTSFNGQKILDGTFGSAAFQVGANVGETISLSLTTSMRQADIGAFAQVTGSVDLSTIASPTATPGVTTTGAVADWDFSTVAATPNTTGTGGTFTALSLVQDSGNAYSLTVGGVAIYSQSANTGSGGDITVNAASIAGDGVDGATGGLGNATVQANLATAGITVSGTVAGGDLAFTKTDGTAIDVVVVNGTGGGGFAGTDFATGTNNVDNGSAADTSANVTITVAGGGNITLTGADRDANITQLQSALNTQAAGTYTVAASGASAISITTTATGAGATAPAIAGTDAATFGTVSTVNGAAGQSVTVNNDFSIQLGTASAVAVANGSYSSPQAIVDAVNTALGGNAIASLNSSNQLVISAGQDDIAITGTVGTTTLGLAASTTASGSLSTANVLDVSAANDAIYRIDSALTSVSDLRSTFGAIQNRFESTIANLSSTTENLSASRSRIQDADFAAETANLTRAQILQQAGVSILAQANALPQNVLALLQ